MDKHKLKDDVVSFMESHTVCHLATGHHEHPGAATVHYVNRGLVLYFTTSDKTEKMNNIVANPRVSLTVDDAHEDWTKIKGIQLKGYAELVPQTEREAVKEAFEKKFPFIREYGGVPAHHVFVAVYPEKIYYLDYGKGLGHREVLHVEKKRSVINW